MILMNQVGHKVTSSSLTNVWDEQQHYCSSAKISFTVICLNNLSSYTVLWGQKIKSYNLAIASTIHTLSLIGGSVWTLGIVQYYGNYSMLSSDGDRREKKTEKLVPSTALPVTNSGLENNRHCREILVMFFRKTVLFFTVFDGLL